MDVYPTAGHQSQTAPVLTQALTGRARDFQLLVMNQVGVETHVRFVRRQSAEENDPAIYRRQLKSDLQQASYNVQQAAANRSHGAHQEQHAGTGVGAGPGPSPNPDQNDDDVIDADYTEA